MSNLFTLCYESCGSAEFCYICKCQTLKLYCYEKF
nr:MAG TPA: hypothetical protein [Caudoviricetes sp.]